MDDEPVIATELVPFVNVVPLVSQVPDIENDDVVPNVNECDAKFASTLMPVPTVYVEELATDKS